jgi:predicted Zn-dependent protease
MEEQHDIADKRKGLIWVVVAIGLGLFAALSFSGLVREIPWSWEKRLSDRLSGLPGNHTCAVHQKSGEILLKIVKRLFPIEAEDSRVSIDVQVARDEDVNAYATLGGHIFVNEGLLTETQSPEEFAGVLAHEIEHVTHRHILESVVIRLATIQGISLVLSGNGVASQAGLADLFLRMSFSRVEEEEADEGALKRLNAAHVSNEGFKDFFERMQKSTSTPSFLSDHPSNLKRMKRIEGFKNGTTAPALDPDEWKSLKGICATPD